MTRVLAIPADLSIPDFLRVENRDKLAPAPAPARPQPRPPRQRCRRFDRPKSMDAVSLALLREIEREHAAKQKRRLAALRERQRR